MQERPQTLDYEPLNGTGSRRVNRFVASLTLGVLGAAASLYFVGSLDWRSQWAWRRFASASFCRSESSPSCWGNK
jgi:hypothetical protein